MDALDVGGRAERYLEAPADERRAGLVGERRGLLCGERVAAADRVVVDVAACRLSAEPFAHVALRGPGPLGQLRGIERPGLGERAVEPEAIADHDQGGVHGRAELNDRLTEERVQSIGAA